MKKSHSIFSAAAALLMVAALVMHPGTARIGPSIMYPPIEITGARNPDVTQANIKTTICVPGWTSTIRPSSSYTTLLKIHQVAAGMRLYKDSEPSHYEEDHFLSLELGGAPEDPANLWPEPYFSSSTSGETVGAHQKDQVENFLHRQVCAGTITLKDAQDAILHDWYAIYSAGKTTTDSYDDPDDDQ